MHKEYTFSLVELNDVLADVTTVLALKLPFDAHSKEKVRQKHNVTIWKYFYYYLKLSKSIAVTNTHCRKGQNVSESSQCAKLTII